MFLKICVSIMLIIIYFRLELNLLTIFFINNYKKKKKIKNISFLTI